MATRDAACSCGQLHLTTEGDPIRISMCHCLACQRRTGSAFGIQARFTSDRVQIAGRYSDYVRISDDGEEATFHFCPDCGATVFYVLATDAVSSPFRSALSLSRPSRHRQSRFTSPDGIRGWL
jgi:hypothetical protein